MADKQPVLTVPQEKSPSIFNRTAAAGLALGVLLPVSLPVAALATGIGAFLGYRRTKQEQETGKQVSPPGRLNLGSLFGGLTGMNLAVGIGLAVMAVATPAIGMAVLLGGAFALPIAGAIIGNKIGRTRQEKAYQSAVEHVAVHGEFHPQQHAPAQGIATETGLPQAGHSPAQQSQLATARTQIDPQQLAQLQALASQGEQMAANQPPQGKAEQLQQQPLPSQRSR